MWDGWWLELLGQVGVVWRHGAGVEMKVTDEDVGPGSEGCNSSPVSWEDLPLPSYLALMGQYFVSIRKENYS